MPAVRPRSGLVAPLLALCVLAPSAASAESFDKADTAWMLVATALVLFMTLPGLALFYGGLVRTKNVLSVLMQCIALAGTVTLVWLAFGYSLAFDSTGMVAGERNLHSFIGSFAKSFLAGVGRDTAWGTIPEVLFFAYQLTFAIITPGLIIGAFPERTRFSAMLAFSLAWLLLVYLPICHMTWGGPGGFFADLGVLDFAGGIVVHLTAGVSALVACLVIGPRRGYGKTQILPHNMTMCFTGTGMLWVGWYGFNGGSALAANGTAAMAITVSQISASTAAITWMALEWTRHGRPSVLGVATGAVAGLAAVTPASGFVGPVGGFGIGVASAVVCYFASTRLKQRLGYDDSLDVFGVHGVGGLAGTVLAGVFSSAALGGVGVPRTLASQVGVQLFACGLTIAWSAGVSWLLLKAIDAVVGLRIDEEGETRGLDQVEHGESGYSY